MSISVSGSQITFNDNSTQNTSATGFGFKNRIINGGMVIDQRNAGASVTGGVGYTFPVDRFKFYSASASKISGQRSTTAPTGFTNSLLLTSLAATTSAAGDEYQIYHTIEGFNAADLGFGTDSAQSVTLSFQVRSSLTGTFAGCLFNNDGTRSYIYTYTIAVANTWEQKTITIAGDTSGTWNKGNELGLGIIWDLGSGSNFTGTAGAWASAFDTRTSGSVSVIGTNGATFYITGVQLEKGSTATSFDYRPYGTELALCQRYYQLIVSGLDKPIAVGDYYTATQVEAVLQTKVTMRTSPTLSSTTGTNYYRAARNGGTDTFNSLTGDISFENALLVYNASEASGTAGHGTRLETSSSSAFLAFQAEL